MRIDGLHPNAEIEVNMDVWDKAMLVATREYDGALPKHIHIKPEGVNEKLTPMDKAEVQPTEVVETLDEILQMAFIGQYARDADGNFHPVYDTFNVLKDNLKTDIEEYVADRERKAAVEALKKLFRWDCFNEAYAQYNNTTNYIAAVKHLIAQYERGE